MITFQQKQKELFSQMKNDPARLIEEQDWKELILNENERQLIPEIQKGLKETHHLNGLYYLFDVPYLIFRLPSKKCIKEIAKDNHLLTFTPRPLSFGSSIEFMLGFVGVSNWSMVYINEQDIDISKFSKGKFKVLLFYEQRFIKIFSVDISNSKPLMELMSISLDEINNNEIIFKDALAHYWENLSYKHLTKPQDVRNLNIEDKLSIGWLRYFATLVKLAYDEIQNLRKMGSALDLSGHKFNPIIREVFNLLYDKKVGIEIIISKIKDFVIQNNNSFNIDWFAPSQAIETMPMQSSLVSINSCYFYSPENTNCGQYLPWIDFDSTRNMDKIERLKISPNEFNDQELAVEYWTRLPRTIQMNQGLFLKGSDFPVSLDELKKDFSSMVLDSPLNEVESLVKDKLSEALANKIWSIPWGAKVDLSRLFLGPFKFVEIYEYKGGIYFVFRANKGEFFNGSLNPLDNSWDIDLPVTNEQNKMVLAIIKLNLSAIIRDFWVVENREKVFSQRLETQKNIRKGGNPKKTIIIYLPRIKYTPKPNIQKTKNELNYSERRVHWVSFHIRKCQNPSDYQLILAKRYNFKVPKGYTFVKPFEKGKKKSEIIFRSRSALQLLYEIKAEIPEKPSGKVDWFKFEQDVQSLMESLGYEVAGNSPSQRGDGGVDIFATKKVASDQEKENWIIQCKCWKQKNKIPPGVIRELKGVLSECPSGTHGMVVTTSSFSSGAIKEARDAGIRLIDGNEFSQLLLKMTK